MKDIFKITKLHKSPKEKLVAVLPVKTLLQDQDFYLNEDGLMVFTETYHLRRGTCCQSNCRHCPYGFSALEKPSK